MNEFIKSTEFKNYWEINNILGSIVQFDVAAILNSSWLESDG